MLVSVKPPPDAPYRKLTPEEIQAYAKRGIYVDEDGDPEPPDGLLACGIGPFHPFADEIRRKKREKTGLVQGLTDKAPKGSVRPGHEWTVGVPGTYTDADLEKLANRYIACPRCSDQDFEMGSCHVKPIIESFKAKFPDHCPPTFVSMGTTNVSILRDVLLTKDAVFAGCSPPRGAPTVRELGVRLPRSIFGNPEKLKVWAEQAEARKAKKRSREMNSA